MNKHKRVVTSIILVILIILVVSSVVVYQFLSKNDTDDAFSEFHSNSDTENAIDNLVDDIENSAQGEVSNIEELGENNLDYFDSYFSIDYEINQESVESLMPCIINSGVSYEDYVAVYTGLVNTFDTVDSCVRSNKKVDVTFSYMMSYILDINETATVYICIDYKNGVVYVKQI